MTAKTATDSPEAFLKDRFNLLGLIVLGSFFGVAFWSAHAVFVLDNVAIYAENGQLETLQAGLLAIGCLVFMLPVVLNKGPGRLIPLFFALLCYSFLVRELDVERLDVPAVLKFIGSGVGRNTTLIVAFTTLLVCAGTKFSYYKSAGMLFLRSSPGILLMLGGLLLFAGDVFERSHSIAHNAFFEEIFELCGYVFILLAAFAVNAGISRRVSRTPRGDH